MKKRNAIIAVTAVFGVGLVGFALAPALANRYAAAEVDKALDRVRRQNTAVATRGEVSFSLFDQVLVIRDVAVDTPGDDGSKIRVARVEVDRPGGDDAGMTAEAVRLIDITVASANETLTIPSIAVAGYRGPAQGLVSPPRVGRAARTQADMMAQVSIDSGVIPELTTYSADLKATRVLRGLSLKRMVNGVADEVTAESFGVDMPAPGGAVGARAGLSSEIAADAMKLQGVSLPALMRFHAGDGQGEREAAIRHAEITRLRFGAPTKSLGVVTASVGALTMDDLALRPLAFATPDFERLGAKARQADPLTPAEIRQLLLMGVDAVRAVSIGRISARDIAGASTVEGAAATTTAAKLIELQGLGDGKLGGVRFEGFALQQAERRFVAGFGSLASFDATGLLAYAQEVGSDKTLLTRTPAAEEMMTLTPRAASVELNQVELSNGDERMTLAKVRTGQRSLKTGDLPNDLSFAVERFDAPLPPRWRIGRYLQDAGVERLNLSFVAELSLDPTTQTLKLEQMAYRSPDVADITLTGALADFDAKVAVERGGVLVQKLSDVTVEPFNLKVVDHGGLAAAIAYAADRVGKPPEIYREDLARQVEATVADILGPSAESSGRALGLFVRKGGALDIAITPRGADTRLLQVLQLIGLGPQGLAQALDLTIVTRNG